MTTGMERFAALMSGQTPDRVPIVCNLLDQGARELGVSIREYYSRGELVAEGQLAMREKYGYDTLLGLFYAGLEAEIMGCHHIIYADNGPPNVGHLIIRKPEDIKKLHLSDDLHAHPRFRELAKCIGIMKRESAGRWPVLGEVSASFSLPAMLMGIGQWLDLFLNGDPGLRDLLLEKCSQFSSRQIIALREAGADLIVYANPVASATFITPQKSRQLALPWTIKDLEEPGTGGVVFFNGGGRINPNLADLQAHTGIDAYYLNPFDDIIEARRILGPQALIAGAINDIRLIDWSPEEIDREVEKIMLAGKQGGGFIFGTMMMPFRIPEENIRALVDAAIRHGRYQPESV
ncbi:MAG: uroporphyrinogen decarboxylase family protein [Desulfuromonadaceae bacterium]|nr:uroporphyrinogen decarboxylase family protein [Desulfuromonadaceae bacterium]